MFQKQWQKLKRFPIVLVFFLFLFGFSVLDMLWPGRDFSELENRKLAQEPVFSLASVTAKDDPWMDKYTEYVKDQFAFRDGWIDLKSRAEAVLLKTENNGVWLGKDNYLFAKYLSVGSRFEMNLGAVERMAERHPGKVSVMIVPSASLILSDKLPWQTPAADEDAALDTILQRLSGKAAAVYDLREALGAHRDEYIFYRTDHHWTSEGAWLAYEQFAQAHPGDFPLFDRAAATEKQVEDFYGTNYSKARNYDVVPDVITYYDLPNILTIYTAEAGGTERAEPGPLYNYADFETRDKYKAFLRGNNGYSVLEGDGTGSILVIKDSYANAFLPYLTADYATIGIVDYRYLNERVDSLVERGGYDEILVLYSFQGFMNDLTLAAKIATA